MSYSDFECEKCKFENYAEQEGPCNNCLIIGNGPVNNWERREEMEHTGEFIEENNQRTDPQILSNAVKEQIEKVTQSIDPVEENLMAVRHARELAHLIENGSEEDHQICAEALVKKAPGVVLDALKARFLELTDVVKDFKAMAKGL